VFSGTKLLLNVSTSAVGRVRVELQDADGGAVRGRSLDDAEEIFGDEIERVVRWRDGDDVGDLAGRTVRLRIALADADLYSFRFR
jgi:hypothetical protein